MAGSHTWGPAMLLLVAATSQLSQALRSQQVANTMAHPGNGVAEGGGGPEGSSEAVGEAAAKNVAKRTQDAQRRRACRGGRSRSTRELRRNAAEAVAAAASAPERTSDSEAEDDLVVILEDHTHVMPLRLLAFESSPASDDLQEIASIKPQLTKLDGLHGSEVADPDGQAMQRKTAILNLCNNRIHVDQLYGSTAAFTRGVVHAAARVIRSSLGKGRSKRKQAELAQAGNQEAEGITTYWSLHTITVNWKENPPPQHEVARALLDACNAMFRKNMSTRNLQSLINRYDKIIALLTKNVD